MYNLDNESDWETSEIAEMQSANVFDFLNE